MRSDEGAYLVDGPVLLREALDAGAPLRAVYVEVDQHGRPGRDRADLGASIELAAGRGARVRPVQPGALTKVLDLGAPQSVVAVVERRPDPADTLAAAAARSGRPLLVLVQLADPGNVGTLVRTAEASGCAGVLVVGDGVDPYNPKSVRATAGSLFRVPLAALGSAEELFVLCARHGVAVMGTAGAGGCAPERADLGGAVAVLVGNEAHGLSDSVLERCDGVVAVPMLGQVESLNAAVAGSVVAFEAARQRRIGAGAGPVGVAPTGAAAQRSGGPTAAVGHDGDPAAAEPPPGERPPENGSAPR